jgi:hypothetical protein
MSIRRLWSATCADGAARDQFVSAVAHRIEEENADSAAQGYPPVLVEDFVARCDALFAAHSPATPEAAQGLAEEIDIADLYDLTDENAGDE